MFSILGGDGKEYGPVAAVKIQEWIAAGRANLQTRARRAGDAEWRTLGEFPEFNPAAIPAVPATPPLPATDGQPAFAPALPTVPAPAFAPAAPVTTLVLASRGLRLVAAILDSIVGGCFVLPGFVLLVMAGAFSSPSGEPFTPVAFAGIAVGLAGLFLLLILQIYLLTTRGQTVGKLVVGIKIVTFDTDENPGFVKAFLLRSFVNGAIGGVPVLGGIYTIVDICFIFREDKRCIHDLIAGTRVVKA